ncbi:uncharacterized protein LOC111055804 [Nilaparvata lugens]|uniref:uncharacterized protein LOC111055804 n=1 Tax=Nilaparvata lugens TaxID=108931 RepID=UPI00193DFBA2|nr:uncharacterized protein LOC111055804 [Nilaparvata lugens]
MMDEERVPLLWKAPTTEKQYNEGSERREGSKSSSIQGLSLLSATLCIVDLFGVFPVVTMPRIIINCGWFGFPLVLGVLILQVYTALLLGRCWIMAERLQPSIVKQSRRPYAALAEMTYGESFARLVTFILDITVFGAGVPNLIVGKKLIHFKLKHSMNNYLWLVVSSSMTVTTVSLLTWHCFMASDVATPPPLPSISWEAIAIGYGVLAFQFDIHPTILTIQVDMADKGKIGCAVIIGFLVTGTLFLTTSVLGAIYYSTELDYNVMQTLQPSLVMDINVLLVILQICLSTVIGATPLFQDLEDKLGVDKEFNLKRILLRSGLVMLSLALAEMVPRFDLIMGLIGGTLMGPLMFVLPPLFYARLRAMEPQPQLRPVATRNTETATIITVAFAPQPPDQIEYSMKQTHYTNPRRSQKPRRSKQTFEGKSSYNLIPKEKYLDDLPSPTSQPNFFTKIKSNFLNLATLDDYPKIGPMTAWERLKTAVVVIAGVSATLISTYYSVRGTIRYARFAPPCLFNVTAATLAIED